MMVGVAGAGHSDENPNVSWLNSRGMWLTYVLAVTLLHLTLLAVPWLSVAHVWTLTNVTHSLIQYFMLHNTKGTPWLLTTDQGAARRLTHWEQIDHGTQFTATRKFLIILPIMLFFLASFYTKYDAQHFLVNLGALLLATLPKLPVFHKVRLFGINKY